MSDIPENNHESANGEELEQSAPPLADEIAAEDLQPVESAEHEDALSGDEAGFSQLDDEPSGPTSPGPSSHEEGWDAQGAEENVADAEDATGPGDEPPQPERADAGGRAHEAATELVLPTLEDALQNIYGLGYPMTTLVLPPARAVGHHLASPVLAKSNLPLRPFALVDGLAVNSSDLLLGRERQDRREREDRRRGRGRGRGRAALDEGQAENESLALQEADETGLPGQYGQIDPGGQLEPGGNESLYEAASNGGGPEQHDAELAEPDTDGGAGGPQMARLSLRPAPQTSRKDDSVGPGEAVPIAVGDEVPRGCDFVVPFAALEGEPRSLEPPQLEPPPAKWQAKDGTVSVNKGRMRDDRERQAAMRRDRDKAPAPDAGETDIDDDDLPSREPAREWELAQYFQEGSLELPRVERLGGNTLVNIGAWARNRDALFPERTLLRAGEVSLLEALGIPEVEVVRRPIVGIASLSEPLPSPNRAQQRRDGPGPKRGGRANEAMQMAGVSEARTAPERPERPERPQRGRRGQPPPPVDELEEFEDLDLPSGICPLTQLCMHLCRTAQVAALPLGYAPKRFRQLSLRMERWLNQVDVLLLVGGSHHGPRSLAQDVIATYGKLAVAGVDVHPGGNISAGSLAGKPVFSMPGSLPQVLAGFVLFVRPLLHRHMTPLHFEGELPVMLEQGSRISFPYTTAAALRYGYNPERRAFSSRYSGPRGGRDGDPWMDFIRGQAIAVFEGGRQYEDGDFVTVYPY